MIPTVSQPAAARRKPRPGRHRRSLQAAHLRRREHRHARRGRHHPAAQRVQGDDERPVPEGSRREDASGLTRSCGGPADEMCRAEVELAQERCKVVRMGGHREVLAVVRPRRGPEVALVKGDVAVLPCGRIGLRVPGPMVGDSTVHWRPGDSTCHFRSPSAPERTQVQMAITNLEEWRFLDLLFQDRLPARCAAAICAEPCVHRPRPRRRRARRC
jgi:hypothetical protein